MHEYDKMLQWVKNGGGRRAISIEIGRSDDCTYIRKWAYDFDLKVGQLFDSIDEVNLEKEKEKKDRLEYLRLKQKFEKEAF